MPAIRRRSADLRARMPRRHLGAFLQLGQTQTDMVCGLDERARRRAEWPARSARAQRECRNSPSSRFFVRRYDLERGSAAPPATDLAGIEMGGQQDAASEPPGAAGR